MTTIAQLTLRRSALVLGAAMTIGISLTLLWQFGTGVSANALIDLSAGVSRTCAVTTSGGVKCWGSNSDGLLGSGTATDQGVPVDVTGLTSGVTAVSVGLDHTCVLTREGGVKCWSLASGGTPVDVEGLTGGAVSISAGWFHTCALTKGGGVKCWGYNLDGQLGNGTTTNSSAPVDVTGLMSGVVAISAGGLHTCAVTTWGSVKCWGDNSYGQLGDGSTTDSAMPVDAAGLTSGYAGVAAGYNHSCALRTGGGVVCWGFNSHGQLGDGTTTGSAVPVDVTNLSDAASVSAGDGHTCALTLAGSAKCWGENTTGELGNGTTSDSSTPLDVSGLDGGVAAVSTGGRHTCVLTTAGSAECWGANYAGQLGNGTGVDSSTPVDVSGIGPKSTPTPGPTPRRGLAGDANEDGQVNAIDAALILQHSSGLLTAIVQNADANADGEIDAVDAAIVLQYSAGLIDSLPV